MSEVSEAFEKLVRELTDWLAGRSIAPDLSAELDVAFPATGPWYAAMREACVTGVEGGRLATRGEPNLRYGRAIKPSPETHDFSIDVVRMSDVAGPHHVHPNGEVDLVVPLDAGARFDGHGAGWVVYGAGSAHAPTVSGGSAIVLYALPAGAIRF